MRRDAVGRGGGAAAVASGRRSAARRWLVDLQGYAFLAPALGLLGVFTLIPIVFSFGLSFFRWDMMRPQPRFLGVDNFVRLVRDPAFHNALGNTLLYAVGTVVSSVAISLVLALFLNRTLRGRVWFRSAFFAPVVTSTVAVSLVWSWIYHPQVGLLNAGLGLVGLGPVRWLADPDTAIWAIVGLSVWKSAGVMTQGGPALSTEMVVTYLFHRACRTYEMGYASAIAWGLFVVIVGLTVAQSRFVAREGT